MQFIKCVCLDIFKILRMGNELALIFLKDCIDHE